MTLVSKAYSSIDADDFAVFMGMPLSEAIQGLNFFMSSSRTGFNILKEMLTDRNSV